MYYFRHVPEFDYPSRLKDAKKISEYTRVKNLFKRAKLADDIFADLSYFEKYKIIGDDRPDNVAYKVYGDETLDWLVLLANNVINQTDEWPLAQQSLYNYLLDKYVTDEGIGAIHHYETEEFIFNGIRLVPAGLTVDEDFRIEYYNADKQRYEFSPFLALPITNYEFEHRREDAKRNIFLIKQEYVQIVMDDMRKIMPYKKGGDQYVNPTLKRAENIRLFQ